MNRLGALKPAYDLVIIGGGITGAGILREAIRTSASVLLLEQNDFASGTSSCSSKLVHGGLRYLKNGQWRLTLESVRERQRLMREAPGLIHPQPFLMPLYQGSKPGKAVMRMGLFLYDLMAGHFKSRSLDATGVLALEPDIRKEKLLGAVSYEDAGTDDARLVLRLIFDAMAEGAEALNYVHATMPQAGVVLLHDHESKATREIQAGVVVHATGAWAGLAPQAPLLRPLRGSHFVFSQARFPLRRAVSWLHPKDQRPIFAYPWEGAVVYGTTDLDHAGGLEEPVMTPAESAYLMEGVKHQFPNLNLRAEEAVSTYSGIRPVVAGGAADPSAESRESAMWSAPGMVGITGGKLTTFRVTARQVLAEAAKQLPVLKPVPAGRVFAETAPDRLSGRLGAARAQLGNEREFITGTPYCWAELRHALRHEQVFRLTDLLMRRTRIGLVMVRGGAELLPRLKILCQQELGWNDDRWQQEEHNYLDEWQRLHAPVAA